MEHRIAEVVRNTKETKIRIRLDLDGTGKAQIRTGIGFFDHMLNGFARHGLFDLEVEVDGDLEVDCHHTIEDTGIVLGQAIRQAVGDKAGMKRFGYFILPMDDALALCAVDLGGRAYFSFDGEFQTERVGDFETQLVTEFFYALTSNAQMNLHIRLLAGQNDHHKIEAIFKAFGKALDQAVSMDERISGVLSTKGSL